MLSAFEAHIINVTAQIENGVITTVRELTYGTVFPQESLDQDFEVTLSDSFLEEDTVGTQYATGFLSNHQGKRKNNTTVLPLRSNPANAFGAPQSTGTPYDNPVVEGTFFALGFSSTSTLGGSIVFTFDNFIVNVPGTDITVFEITGGTSYPDERAKVEASQDGNIWVTLVPAGIRDINADLATGGLAWAKFVRVTDISVKALFENEADAYDVDAVRATSQESLGEVNYVIRQKPKCGLPVSGTDPVEYSDFGLATEDDLGNFECVDEGYLILPLLCPYLSKHELTEDPDAAHENDSVGINAFHGLPGTWTMSTTLASEVAGMLSNPLLDIGDKWNIDLKVPCFQEACAQDWPDFIRTESGNPDIDVEVYKADPAMEHQVYGCDLWLEVTGIL